MGKLISIGELEEGMILDEPVVNNYGQILLNKGVSLTFRHKKVFLTWNIKSLNIKSSEEESQSEFSQEQLELSENRLKSKVKWIPRLAIEKDLLGTAIILNARAIFGDDTKIQINY